MIFSPYGMNTKEKTDHFTCWGKTSGDGASKKNETHQYLSLIAIL